MQKMETRNKLNIEGIRGAIKEKQDKIQMNTKINVGTKCYVSQMRNNLNSVNDNNNSIINPCGSNIKPNITEKEEYLKQRKMLL